MTDAITRLNDEISVAIVKTEAEICEAYRLRYQIYCVEHDFEPGGNGQETDECDRHSTHALIRWRETGEALGTVRLIHPAIHAAGLLYPIEHLCYPSLFSGLPMATCGEISRFALSKIATVRVHKISPGTYSLLLLALVRGSVLLSAEAGHTHWFGVMEPGFLRLLRRIGVDFAPLGPLVDYHGMRQPAVCEIAPTLSRIRADQPRGWDFLTSGSDETGRWSIQPSAGNPQRYQSAPSSRSTSTKSDIIGDGQ